MRYALVKNGVVENIIVCNDENYLNLVSSQWDHMVPLNQDDEVKIGWLFDGDVFPSPFVNPEISIPEEVPVL